MGEKMRFSAYKLLKLYAISNNMDWIFDIDGMEVEFNYDTGVARCGDCYVIKEWCEPINSSDNNDK